jgi:hypothetical protein
MNAFFVTHGLYGLPAGNTGAQMGGWFRKEINTVDDLKGLKFRVGGIGGQILEKLGVVTQRLPGVTSTRHSKEARSMRPSGSGPTTTSSSVSTRSPNTTITPAGGKAGRSSTSLLVSTSGTNCPSHIRQS